MAGGSMELSGPRCNARTRSANGNGNGRVAKPGPWAGPGYCKREAGWGTGHFGQGRCKQHGGATPIKSGRYSLVQRDELRELIERHMDDPDPLNMLPELATARSLFEEYVNRYEELVEALLAWNAEEIAERGQYARPQRIPELASVTSLVSEITKIAKRIEDVRSQNAISRPELFRVVSEMMRCVRARVDEETYEKINDDWLSIRLA